LVVRERTGRGGEQAAGAPEGINRRGVHARLAHHFGDYGDGMSGIGRPAELRGVGVGIEKERVVGAHVAAELAAEGGHLLAIHVQRLGRRRAGAQ
jgi:hypothetical protein